jgi:hypothetical protein
VEIDYEFILLFKKPGAAKKVLKEVKEASRLSKEEWKEYFSGHWHFGGARQLGHEARFPEELPRRLIRMFSFRGDTVLDPFLGSGTTVKVALESGRNSVGYEINENFLGIIEEKVGIKDKLPIFAKHLQFIRRKNRKLELPKIDYYPIIQDRSPLSEPRGLKKDGLFKIIQIISADKIKLDNGQIVRFLGVKINKENETINYLKKYLMGRKIILKEKIHSNKNNTISAYIYLKNKIFVNHYLIQSGLGLPDSESNHRFKKKFENSARESI